MILDKIWFNKLPPPATNVLWLRPVKGKILIYLFNAGRWQSLMYADNNDTVTVEDDTPFDAKEYTNEALQTFKENATEYIQQVVENDLLEVGAPDDSADKDTVHGMLKEVGIE